MKNFETANPEIMLGIIAGLGIALLVILACGCWCIGRKVCCKLQKQETLGIFQDIRIPMESEIFSSPGTRQMSSSTIKDPINLRDIGYPASMLSGPDVISKSSGSSWSRRMNVNMQNRTSAYETNFQNFSHHFE